MQLNATISCIIALFCIFILPVPLSLLGKRSRVKKWVILALFGIYLIILIVGVWGRITIKENTLKIAFDYTFTAKKDISFGFKNLSLTDALLNLVMLFPVGFVVAYFLKGKPYKKMLLALFIGLVLGIIIETGQYFLPVKRAVQLRDVVFNGVSSALGVAYLQIWAKLLKNKNIMI